MNSSISFQYPVWFTLLCLLAGIAYATLLYYREQNFGEQNASSNRWKKAMAFFRFLAVSVLAILLLSPFLKTRNTQIYKPIVAIVHDNSESIKQGLKKDTAIYEKTLTQLKSELSKKYEIAEFSAGDMLKNGIDFSYTDKSSNLSGALDDINDVFYNRNLGAVIIASDGIYNKGINPVYAAAKSSYSIYTIALGDTTIQRDQKIAGAYFNKIVYLNDNFNLKTEVEANNLSGRNTKLTVYEVNESTQLLQQKDISYNSNSSFSSYDFVLPAKKTGIAHYRIVLSNTEGEVTYKNNTRDIFVEVLDGRQKILLVAHSPHPDIAALKSAIETNKNYEVDVELAADLTKQVRDYSLLILHQLPSAEHKIAVLLKEARDLKKSTLFIIGSQTSMPDFVKSQNAISFRGNQDKFNDVTSAIDKNFSLFTMSEKTGETVKKLPPYSVFFGDYMTNPSSRVLLYQKINSVQTDFPLWVLNETADNKVGVICGEGIWKWHMHDYLLNKNQDATNELINKTVQYLSVKTDKRPFRVSTAKSIFQDNEAVMFEAQLYNSNFELVNQQDVQLKVSGEDGRVQEFTLGKTESAYNLNAGFFAPGNYSYTAIAKMGNGNLSTSGKFSVSPLQLEEMRTTADHQVLYQLATQHNGSMHNLNNTIEIAAEIDAKNTLKPVMYDSFQTESAINLKWIFFLLLGLLAAEWGMRKYLGGY